MQRLTLEQFRASQDAGGVLSVTLKAAGAGFEVQIETSRGPAKLVKTRSKDEPRRFLDPRKALLLLRDLGIREAHIDGQQWRPDEHLLERKPRADRAVAMKPPHEALTHNDWLRQKLHQSAADIHPRVLHDQVMSEAQALIDRKRQAHGPKTPA